jgi:hypothetical protein
MKLSSGLTRLLALFAVSMGLSATAFAAPEPNVKIPLGGKSFGVSGLWLVPTSKNLIASSLPKTIVRTSWVTGPWFPPTRENLIVSSLPNTTLESSSFFWLNTYNYNLTGTVHGEGYLQFFVAPGTPFKTFLDRIKPGSSSILKGQVTTIDGTLIKNTTISGYLDSVFGSARIAVSLTISAKINPDGEILLVVSDMKVASPFASGAIVFDGPRRVDGKTIPGARLAVAVVPRVVTPFK